ncbi:SURF1 family cytochrome oxidase biogenesis protein [Demequina sp.]|uniref:SURF1 family cytochrome oxidase biogenesis protein n=1 Tax=Demequina sp. TaxID=2050685 RepID=UPI003D0DB6DB
MKASLGSRIGVAAFAVVAVVVCGALGLWQWNRAQSKAVPVAPEPSVPIAEVLAPASAAGSAISRQVTVEGIWADEDAVLVPGREVDGEEAVLLVRALIVDADSTGTGQPATLAVIVGWRPADSPMAPDPGPEHVEIDGYLRSPEEATTASGSEGEVIPGTVWSDTISTSELAQEWPSPLYSAVLGSYDGSESWEPLPPPPPEEHLNMRSLLYALEWWVFGAFAVFVAARWLRDNSRTTPTPEESKA